MQGDVGALGIAASLVLVAIAVFLSWRGGLGLERSLVWAATRALVQLLLVGAALTLVVDPDSPIVLSWLWIAAMLVFAADVARRRAPEVPGMWTLALAAFAATGAVTVGVLFGLGIFPIEGRTVVPVAGMVVGNSMKSCVVVVTALAGLMADRRPEIEARLALGLPGIDAARPLVRRALRLAISPQIENTKALGIVFLPGAMTGLILAGVDPLDAVLVQLALMWIILGAVVVTTATTAIAGTRRLFTDDQRLLRLARAPDS